MVVKREALIVAFFVLNLVCPLFAKDPLAGSLWDEHEEDYAKMERKYRGWQFCYEDFEASSAIQVKQASVKLTADGEDGAIRGEYTIRIALQPQGEWADGDVIFPAGSTYTLEFWHQESGTKVRYLGPYDACSGWLGNQTCPISLPQDELVASVKRTLHKDEGNYEATLQIFDDAHRELLCVVVVFQVLSEDGWWDQQQPNKLDLLETTDEQQEGALLLVS